MIIKTLDFLALTGQDQFIKPACINSLICRIQNLLPDKCNLCESEYCVKRDEISLLNCEICGQGSHNACILNLCGVKTEDQEAFDSKKAVEKLNPTGFSGLHYLCGACEANTIPDKEAGLLKRNSSVVTETERENGDTQQALSERLQERISEEETGTEIESVTLTEQPLQSQDSPAPQNQVSQANNEVNQNQIQSQVQSQPQPQPQPQSQTGITVCPHYRKGTCRHGATGRGCPHEHPRPCKKLLQHGNKAPNGCTLGRANCENFHPKMCHTSLTKGFCYDTNCQMRHVTGTKREPMEENNTGQKKHKDDTRDSTAKQSGKKSSDSEDFLGVLHRLKVDMLEAMDTKIAQYISAQTPAPTGNYIRTAIPRMSMAEPAAYMHQGIQGPMHPMSMQTGQPWGMAMPGQPVYVQTGLNPVAPMFMPVRTGGWGH